MSEYRHDPLVDRWVIIAEERANRPNQFDIATGSCDDNDEMFDAIGGANIDAVSPIVSSCPFCPGNEAETPSEVDAIRTAGVPKDSRNWESRVVPNRYPAIRRFDAFQNDEAFLLKYGKQFETDDSLFSYGSPIDGFGHHDVIIETPRHLLSISEFEDREIVNMFLIYRRRLQTLKAEKLWAHALIFKNVGRDAGASLAHTHSQLMAMPFVPPPILNELRRAILYRQKRGTCYWCDMLKHELELARQSRKRNRVVLETEHFIVFCPFASRFPLEVAIFPKWHASHFEELNDVQLTELAFLTRQTVTLLEKTVFWIKGRLSYNIILKSGPFCVNTVHSFPAISEMPPANTFHFYLTILPSLAKAAGFEWGTGLHINPISPETAAEKLRNCAT